MAASYMPAYPANVPVDAGVHQFITTFYSVSDTPGKNQEWVDCFQDGATLVMEKKEATGKDDIFKVREGMWEKVAARRHTVFKVFPASFGGPVEEDEVELMLFGNVVYRLKGKERDEGAVDWAGYAKLVRVEGDKGKQWKFAYYRVYIQR